MIPSPVTAAAIAGRGTPVSSESVARREGLYTDHRSLITDYRLEATGSSERADQSVQDGTYTSTFG